MAVAAPERSALEGSLLERSDSEVGELVHRYARIVVAGEIVTGRLVRLACERHLRWLAESETDPDPDRRFDAEEAGFAIKFFPGILRHYKGEWGPGIDGRRDGLPVHLELWQCFVVGSIFGWLRRTDAGGWLRQIRKLFLEVAKKNGKSLLAAGLGLKLGFFDGEPGAEIYSGATKKDQAKLLWGDGAEMVRRSPKLVRRLHVPPREHPNAVPVILDLETSSKFKPLSSEGGGEDGINAYASLVDEIHRLVDRGLLDMLGESGGARRWSFLGMFTTAGEPGPSIWREEHDYAVRVIEGLIEDDTLLAYVANLDEGDDWTDERVWPKTNPNLDVSVKRDDLRRAVAEAKEKPGKKPAILRLRFNIVTGSAAKAIDLDRWGRCSKQDLIAPEAAQAWAGLDLGWNRDLSAFALWIPNQDGTFDYRLWAWCPEESAGVRQARDRIPYRVWAEAGFITLTEGNVRDDDAVLEGILEATRPFRIVRIRYDQAMSTNLVNRLQAAGFEVEPQAQTNRQIAPAWKEFERLYLGTKVRTGGNPVLDWMAGNVVTKEDGDGNPRPSKAHENSPDKIDGISAGLDAIAGWLDDAGEAEDDVEPFVLSGNRW